MIIYVLYNRATPGERIAERFEESLKRDQIEVEPSGRRQPSRHSGS